MEAPPETQERKRGFFRDLPGLVIISIVLALVIKTFLVQAFFIPSGSMIPTLKVGDRVLVNKLVYNFSDPDRFDIIVFEDPISPEPDRGFFGGIWHWLSDGFGVASAREEQDFIKRVVGLPGDEVELRGGEVLINGEAIDQPLGVQEEPRDFGPITVEPGKVFVMGDNRGNSSDSRYGLGQIPYDKIVGQAFVLLWPPSHVNFLPGD